MWEIYNWKTLDSLDDTTKKLDMEPQQLTAPHKAFTNIMRSCTNEDPEKRPTFKSALSDLFRVNVLSEQEAKEDKF